MDRKDAQESIGVLRVIYAAAELRGLRSETDYFAFIAEKKPEHVAEEEVWKVIHLDTPSQQYQFDE